MKIKCRLVSFLLLFLLGVNLLAGASSFHSEQLDEHSVGATFSQLMDGSQPSLHSATDCTDETHTKSSHCTDPCHTGRCHFGHCSYQAVKIYFGMAPHLSLQSHLTYDLVIPKGPFLEGPKRPPRHSQA